MVARRTSSRRRRVLNDEIVRTDEGVDSELVETGGDSKPRRSGWLAYSSGANRRNQPKTTDLLPKRWLPFSGVATLLVAIIGCLNLLAWFSPRLHQWIGDEGMSAFAISGQGTIANWFLLFLLILSSFVSLQIYSLRKHRRDDYQGSYRVWLWMSGLFLLASVDRVVGLQSIAANVFENVSQRTLASNQWVSLAIPVVLMSVVVARLILEVRNSRAAIASVVGVWLAFAGVLFLQTPYAAGELEHLDLGLISGNGWLVATTGLLLSLLVYARFVYLRAQGLIEVAQREPKVKATRSKTKAKTKARKAKSKPKSKTTEAEVSESEDATIEEEVVATKSTKTSKSKTTKKASTTKKLQVSSGKRVSAKSTKSVKSKSTQADAPATPASHKAPVATSFEDLTDVLKQKKSKQKSTAAEAEEEPEILSMSKSERRRLRKKAKRMGRAA